MYKKVTLITLSAVAMLLHAQAQTTSSITSGFNGTDVQAGDWIWFNAHLSSVSFSGDADLVDPVTLIINNQSVSFTDQGIDYNIALPDSVISFDSGNTSPSGVYDGSGWTIEYDKSGSNDPFFNGLLWQVPAPGLTDGADVVWSGDFATDTNGISLSWRWSAAVYSDASLASYASDPNLLDVALLDGDGASQSGSPVAISDYVIGGARGGGGDNLTGSNSGTASLTPTLIPEPSSSMLVSLSLAIFLLRRKRRDS